MSSSIKISDLQKEVMEYLENYVEDIEEEVKETTDKISKEAVQELKKDSPRGKGTRKNPYWKA